MSRIVFQISDGDMRLTSFSDFSMRVLMVAAVRTPKLTTVSEVATSFGLSESHIVKCVHQLGQWGFLETVRGNGGGFRLARAADDIRLGDVLRCTEENFCLTECFNSETNLCRLAGLCRLQSKLSEALAAFLHALDQVTLSDIMIDSDRLHATLGLENSPSSARSGRTGTGSPGGPATPRTRM